MLNLLRVELVKMIQHRWQIGFTLWMFPMGMFGIFFGFILITLLSDELRQTLPVMDWQIQVLGPWAVATDVTVQLLPMAFAAAFFAGETQWGTWKNILTRTTRTRIILVKYVAIVLMIMFAFFLSTVVGFLGSLAFAGFTGTPLSPAITADNVGLVIPDYLIGMVSALFSIMMSVCYVAIAALLMRSIMGGTIGGFLVSVLFKMLILPINILYNIFGWEWLPDLYRFTPGYNMDNISAWLNAGSEGLKEVMIPTIRPPEVPDPLIFSLVVIAVWVVVLVSAAVYIFNKQDVSA